MINDRDGGAIFCAKRDGKRRAVCINTGDGLTDLGQVRLAGFDSTRLVKQSCAALLKP